ncbi:YdbH domain-containing protein [Sphingomonas elodea]|uniref:YdbH domain-containing protein n=1 Tax=Sphingomonas elodea TaxID=179878 RepID=UPI0002631048|nr:YdbH domain-containing protein [Sphingomonas elodea]
MVLLAVVLATTWLQRRTIARSFVDRELARRGVPARYTIDQLSPWRQRLTNVVLGDPRDPDLVADWIELRTALTPWRADLLVARAGRVRIKGRLSHGTLSLGSLDRLMPPPSGKPFVLPRLSVDVDDARFRLESGFGPLTLALRGRGLLSDGFTGLMRVDAPRLRATGCVLDGVTAALQLHIRKGAPSLAGPLAAGQVSCTAMRAAYPRAELRVDLDPGFARWKGAARVALQRLAAPWGSVAHGTGTIDFAGDRLRTAGKMALQAGAIVASPVRAASASVSGSYVLGQATGFAGTLALRDAALAESLLARVTRYRGAGAGTPLAPLAPRLTEALERAGRRFDADAAFDILAGPKGTTLRLNKAHLAARSGARLGFDGGQGAVLDLPSGAIALAGELTMQGGGLPDAALRLSQEAGDDMLRGTGEMRPYAAGGASLGLARLDVRIRGRTGAIQTVAALSGPLGSGRIDGLSMPIAARWDGSDIAVNPGCETLAFARLAVAGMVLNRQQLQLCPLGAAMLRLRGRTLDGGIRAPSLALAGTMGGNPLSLAATGLRLDWRARAFDLADVVVRMGAERPTRLDIARLNGTFGATMAGSFEGLGGQIGAVPLVVSQGKGRWQVAEGDLSLLGSFRLADAEPMPRFEPLVAPEGRLRLHDGKIEVQADLVGTKRPVPVAKVTITHDLGTGGGQALLDVPGIRFQVNGLQPSDLTPLTFGIIADVDGLVAGSGRIAWSGETVTSTGRFSATNLALAAAFGPVQGLTTTLDFADLLNVRSAPGQLAEVAEINPGVPVRNGTFRYQLLDSRRVRVEGARWPFAGGELVLDPTTLDFNEAGQRRMTFQVKGVDAALFLKEMAFDNLDATGTFDGTLPMIFDETGGRIEGGELRARAGGHIAYVGEVSRENLGTWGNMAFQALKSLDYKNLAIRMNGPLAGEMITDISFSGLSQGAGTKSNFLIRRLARLPLQFNVRINAPFRQLLDSVQSWYDPRRLIERNLPALIEEQKRAEEAGKPTVQPRESAPRP